jgi:hypothetical protein
MRTSLVLLSLLLACSKSDEDYKTAAPAGSAATTAPAASGSAAGSGSSAGSAEPAEAATVVGPTKSASGTLELGGALAGKFEWIKKDQKSPISCAWSAEKEIGGLRVDLSDGAGRLIKMTIDVPPTELGAPMLDVESTSLPAKLKTRLGFNMSGDGDGHMEVKFDATLTEDGNAPPASKKKGAKAEPPAGPTLTIKGTLEVTCPPKK